MILAFDPGKATGYAVIDRGNILEYGTIKQKGELSFIADLTNLCLCHEKPEVVFIERPFVGGNKPQAICSLSRTVQMIRVAILTLYPEMKITEIPPSEIKKTVTGNGNAKKEQVQEMLRQIYKDENFREDLTLDQSYAIAVGYTGLSKSPKLESNQAPSLVEFTIRQTFPEKFNLLSEAHLAVNEKYQKSFTLPKKKKGPYKASITLYNCNFTEEQIKKVLLKVFRIEAAITLHHITNKGEKKIVVRID